METSTYNKLVRKVLGVIQGFDTGTPTETSRLYSFDWSKYNEAVLGCFATRRQARQFMARCTKEMRTTAERAETAYMVRFEVEASLKNTA